MAKTKKTRATNATKTTSAELLKPHGYATGQFGKNHLGDRDEHLPTMHGFDEFFGNLYHLNAEEEPELRDYPDPKEFPQFRKKFGPRGVLHCWADDKGGQKIKNTGPLTKKRMETCDEEFLEAAKKFIKRANKAGTPFFVWFNTSHMHFRTHAKPESLGQAGRWQSEYHDVMIDHDKHIGELLDLLEELGIADDTFVMYSTDNGSHMNVTPFRSEKNSNWEGAMAGEDDVKETLLAGTKVGKKKFKVHLDGYNLLPFVAQFLDSFKAYPPRQKAASFTIDQVLEALSQPASGAN